MPAISQSRSGEEMFPVVRIVFWFSRLPSEAGPYGTSAFPSQSRVFCRIAPPHRIVNNAEFLPMLVFDKWTCNSDCRQVMFTRANSADSYSVTMIDNGYCFNGIEWNFPNLSKGGLSPRPSAYVKRSGGIGFF